MSRVTSWLQHVSHAYCTLYSSNPYFFVFPSSWYEFKVVRPVAKAHKIINQAGCSPDAHTPLLVICCSLDAAAKNNLSCSTTQESHKEVIVVNGGLWSLWLKM